MALGSVPEMNVKLVLNTAGTISRFAPKYKKAQMFLDNEVLKDSSPYVPMQTGNLDRSGQRGTQLGSGKVIYNAPYARPQYYRFPQKNKDKHPLASMAWFEKAKGVRKSSWIRGVNSIVRG